MTIASPEPTYTESPIPCAAGVGLRHCHLREVSETRPDIPWWEVHSENFFGAGGPPIAWLEKIRKHYPISFHGVGLSLGSKAPVDAAHLAKLKAAADRFCPALVSEHVAWSRVEGISLHDLLPVPYTDEALSALCDNIDRTQEALQRRILIENPSAYLAFTTADMTEPEFLNETARRTGCGLLLDVNNVYVSTCNLGGDAARYLQAIDAAAVGEIHLAGYHVNTVEGQDVLIDSHGARVFPEVWTLYAQAIARMGPRPTLIEWDTDIPALPVLCEEAARAQRILDTARAAPRQEREPCHAS